MLSSAPPPSLCTPGKSGQVWRHTTPVMSAFRNVILSRKFMWFNEKILFQTSNRFTAKSLSLSSYRMNNFCPTSTNFNLSYKNRSITPAIIMTVMILLSIYFKVNYSSSGLLMYSHPSTISSSPLLFVSTLYVY